MDFFVLGKIWKYRTVDFFFEDPYLILKDKSKYTQTILGMFHKTKPSQLQQAKLEQLDVLVLWKIR